MRTDKELILATKAFAKEDRNKSWFSMLSTLVILIIALSGTYWNIHIAGRIMCSILSGLLLVRTFVIFHDHQHHAILHQSKTADFLMKCFGIYILAPSSIWKRSHDFHHKHNSKLHVTDIGSYSTITKQEFLALSKSQKFGYLAMRHPLNILLGYLTIFMYSFCINSIIKSPKKHLDCGLALAFHFSFGILLTWFGGWPALFLTLVIPHFIACGLGSYLFYVQHNFPGAEFKLLNSWDYAHAATYSTSYFKMNPVMKWFTGNIGYHHIHHLNSRIPFYRLEETCKSMPELNNVKTTSFNIKDIYACLRLKLWDPGTNQMIALSDLEKK
ncbi:MAG TPA: fatty acid desaturase [Cytophagaceae bacterium]|jgi:omega-6 fatty acid desaturase (delta-12 desaturase)|nr:fatty acid desaturase [Cytophagaceae bacterium]